MERSPSTKVQALWKSVFVTVTVLGCGGCLPLVKGCVGAMVEAGHEDADAEASPAPLSTGTVARPAISVAPSAAAPLADSDENADDQGSSEDDQAEPAPAPSVSAGGASSGAPSSKQGKGSFSCNAQGFYMKCPNGGYCMSNLATSIGVGYSRDEASTMAQSLCNKHMSSLVSINNIGGRAYVSSPCRTISCSGK